MKTLLIVIVTLVVSQYLYVSYGPNNPAARAATSAMDCAKWLAQKVDHLLD